MNVLDMVRRHGLTPRKVTAKEYACRCPECGGVDRPGDPSDRFRVWPEQNEGQGSYWCRQCGRGGDAIQFLRDFDGLTFRQACERLGRPLPDSHDLRMRSPKSPDWTPRAPADPEAAWREHAGKLAGWAWEQLMGNDEQLAWLEARGIDVSAANRFALGWLPKVVFRARDAWGLSVIKNEKTGRARPLAFPRGLVIPWFADGAVVKVRIRRADPVGKWPRYHMVPGSASVTTLVPPDRIETVRREVYVVVESELDAYLVAAKAGDLVGAVALGSNSAHPDEKAAPVLRKAVAILNALDFDAAGASERGWWAKHFPQSRRWPVPEGKDPGEAFEKGVDIRAWVKAGLPEGLRSRRF